MLSVSDSQILPSELATQSVRLKEEQLRREEEKVNFNVSQSKIRNDSHYPFFSFSDTGD